MANTYSLIASNTLSSSAASVTFSAIPASYDDLLVRYTSRVADPSADYFVYIRFNGDTATNYSNTRISGNGATASSPRNSNTGWGYGGVNTGAGATSNTFGSNEVYIPKYQATTDKAWSVFGTMENNATTSLIQGIAGLWRNSSAITSIVISDPSGSAGFVSGSSFFLYGIKNS